MTWIFNEYSINILLLNELEVYFIDWVIDQINKKYLPGSFHLTCQLVLSRRHLVSIIELKFRCFLYFFYLFDDFLRLLLTLRKTCLNLDSTNLTGMKRPLPHSNIARIINRYCCVRALTTGKKELVGFERNPLVC